MRLSPVLVVADLPLAELHAARLDGEVYPLDHGFAPIDASPTRETRGAALAARAHPRLIAEQHTAAWVWGGLIDPPAHHEFCARIERRTRPPHGTRFSVREVIIDDDEIRSVGGMPVTSPLRTVVDLARFVDDHNAAEIDLLAALCLGDSVTLNECLAALNARPHLPNKRRAEQRIRAAFQHNPNENVAAEI
jgi:hypothetical protein